MQDPANDDDFTNEQSWESAGALKRGQPKTFAAMTAATPSTRPARFTVDWIDRQRETTHPTDPTYPNGTAIDVALDAMLACRVELPCPAARCGVWIVRCSQCGFAIALNTAGRPDDPRSVRIPCKIH